MAVFWAGILREAGRGIKETVERCLACEAKEPPPVECCLACEAEGVATDRKDVYGLE